MTRAPFFPLPLVGRAGVGGQSHPHDSKQRGTHVSPILTLALLATLSACARKHPSPPPPPIHYLIPPSWQSGQVWFYPRETFSLDETGLATAIDGERPPLTADNEPYDDTAMAAQMQDVQLPAIATVTNLETGLSLKLRINDEGPQNPARIIAVTPRVAQLLRIADGTQVRIQFDPASSEALSHQIQGAAADLPITTAPQAAVQTTTLAPLAGTTQESTRTLAPTQSAPATQETATIAVPLHLPEQLTQYPADPGRLIIDAGHFTHAESARRRMLILGDVNARIVRSGTGREIDYNVEAGPYPDVAAADTALTQVLQDGVTDARITVEWQ